MNRSYLLITAALMVAALLGLTASVYAQGMKMGNDPLEGTWQFVSRKLPDGTMITPPTCIGLQTFTNGMRNFNIGWTDQAGKHSSYSVISSYKLTAKDYTETLMYSCMFDGTGMLKNPAAATAPVYVMTNETKTAPVTMEGQKVTFQMPFDPPKAIIDGNTMTATLEGGFTDTWKRLP